MQLPSLNFITKLAYGSGQFAEGLKNGAMGTFLVFYYSQVLGMPGTMAGVAVGTALMVDAITDPLAGSLSDHWCSKWGRRHPFMLVAMFPLAICFFLLFAPPVRGDWALFVWLVIFTNLTRTAMTFYHVAHLALGAELSTDFSGRISLVGFRMFFNVFGGLAATMIGFQFFFAPTAAHPVGQLNPAAYAPFAATLGLLMVVSIVCSAWGTRQFIPYLLQPAARVSISLLGVLRRTVEDMHTAIKLASFRWLFSGVLLVFLMIGTNAALDLYMYTYFWEFSREDVVKLMPAYAIGITIGAFFGPRFLYRFGKRAALLFGTAWWGGLQVLPIVLRLGGWLPGNDSELLLPILAGIRVLQGIGAVQANVAFGSAMADVADENELACGRRQEGIFFSTSSFSTKFASGMGSFIAGIALDIINWPRGTDIRTGADVPPETIVHLGWVYGPLVLVFSFVTMWCYSHYRLGRTEHAAILEQLEQRRAARESG